MALELSNKVAIVTGASSGFGKAISLRFAFLGAKITLCGRDPARLSSVLAKVVMVSGRGADDFLVCKGDLNDQKLREQIVDGTVSKFGRVDILICNAGKIGNQQSLLTATEELYDDLMDTNLKAAFFLIQKAAPYLEKTKGCVVTTSSEASEMAIAELTIYCMSKIALDQLTRCAAVQLGPKGVLVNSVNPGFVRTNLYNVWNLPKPLLHGISYLEKKHQALSDRVGTPEDVAAVVAFLASDEAKFITGESIKIDGGRTMRGKVKIPFPNIVIGS